MMPRRGKVIATYGRHRQRMVVAQHRDLWTSRDETHSSVFSISSNDSSSASYESTSSKHSISSTAQKKRGDAKRNRKSNNKENRGLWTNQAESRQLRSHSKTSNSSTGSEGIFRSAGRHSRVLQDRNDNGSSMPYSTKKPRPKRRKEAPKKNVAKTLKNEDSGEKQNLHVDSHDDEVLHVYNFSDFDKYSLVISDSAPADEVCVAGETIFTPKRGSFQSQRKTGNSKSSTVTSTPNEQPSFLKMANSKIHDSNLSVIETVDASPVVTIMDVVEARQNSSLSRSRSPDSLSYCGDVLGKVHLTSEKNSPCEDEQSRDTIRCSLVSPANSERSDLQSISFMKNCKVDLSRITDRSLRERRRIRHMSNHDCSGSSYDASQSLFEDSCMSDGPVLCLSRRRDNEKCSNGESVEEENVSQTEEDLSDIKEEDEETDSESDSSSGEEDEETDSESDSSSGEQDEENATSSDANSTHESEEERNIDKDETRYMINSQYMEIESQSHVSVQEISSAFLTPHSYSRSHSKRSSVYQTADSFTTPGSRGNKSVLARSFKEVLTPAKCCKAGRVLSAREKILEECDQTAPLSFTECISKSMMDKCIKIGEGVYGEVFRTMHNGESVALKIIPIEGSFTVNDEPQKTFEEILPEIVISRELCALGYTDGNSTPNFVQVKSVSMVQGSYPTALIRQWDIFHKSKISENDRPDMFDESQLFIVFEFEDCGCDLESFQFEDMTQARSVLQQVTVSLAIAEQALEFEHRDLHWGNVLVKRTEKPSLQYTLCGRAIEVDSCGIQVSIIDFTMSRLCKEGCTVFCDLSTDPTLFIGQGDYQFDVYRLMKEHNSNQWEEHNPYTNVLWIHYLADKLIRGKAYASTTKEHRAVARQFRMLVREITDYHSAMDLLANCSAFTE